MSVGLGLGLGLGIEVVTLGTLSVRVNGRPVDIRLNKALALLVYLAETGRVHRRSSLAGLLWPDRPEAAARNNLRQTLTALRKVIGDQLAVTGDRVQLAGVVSIDTRPLTPAGYGGPFLEGFSLADSDLFDEWVARTRAAHEAVALTVLLRHGESCVVDGDPTGARLAARRVFQLEPWNEEAHRFVMRAAESEGRVHEAVDQYDRCVEALWDHLGLRPEPATLQLLAAIEAGRALASRPSTIQVPSTRLFGRDDQIARVAATLASGESRLVTLVGPGGIGKTRLALAIAGELGACFHDGVVVMALDGIDDPGRVVPTLATACGAVAAGDDAVAVAEHLAGRHQLILIDNAEQVVDAVAAALSTVVLRAPRIACLVTSRSVLGLANEDVEWIDGLSNDRPADGCNSPAVELFLDRARRVVRQVASLDTVEAICRRLGGFPLAIELAAGRLGHLTADEILATLEVTPDVLATDLRDVNRRHRSVKVMLDATFDALEPALADLMERLSVFRGGFGRSAAVSVAGSDAAALHQLVGRSLLIARDDARYEVHELVRQHAAIRASRRPVADSEIRAAHARHHLATLTEAEASLDGQDAVVARDRLLRDFDNVVVAWEWAVEHGDDALLLAAAPSLQTLGLISGRRREVTNLLMSASSAFDGSTRAALCAHALAVSWARFGIDEVTSQFRFGMDAVTGHERDRRTRVLLHIAYGQALERQGDIEQARHLFAHAQELVEAIDDPRLEASLRVAASKNETTAGNFAAALALLMPALQHFEQHHDVHGAAEAQSRLAMVYAEQFRVGPALTADLEALRLYAAVGNRSRAGVSELNVGASFVLCGAWDKAEQHTLAGLAQLNDLDDHGLDPYTWCQLAEIHAGRGQLSDAERLFIKGFETIRKVGDETGLRLKLPEWGRFLTDTGRHEQALLVLREAVEVWTPIGADHFLLTIRAIIARALAGLGDTHAAAHLAGQVSESIEQRQARGLPFPIESIADCARVLTATDPRVERMMELGQRVARHVVDELTDPELRATFLDLADVRLISR